MKLAIISILCSSASASTVRGLWHPNTQCTSGPSDTCTALNGVCEHADSVCCNGLVCEETYGHRRICSKPKNVCVGSNAGCGGGETCCAGLTCQWSPGNHRTCLQPCTEEHKGCSVDGECCGGLTCQDGRCLQAPRINGGDCQQDEIGVVRNGECASGTISGTCVNACCTNCRLMIRYTPIALDMDNSGLVERVSNINVKFDINNNGELEDLHEWFAPTEGILVDVNAAGVHMSGAHLFGDEGGKYKNGFEKLSLLDTNGDGLITGDELKGLKLWFDANTNAFLDAGELQDLSSYDIESLSLHEENMVGHATKVDGRVVRMEDLWFNGENVDSTF